MPKITEAEYKGGGDNLDKRGLSPPCENVAIKGADLHTHVREHTNLESS